MKAALFALAATLSVLTFGTRSKACDCGPEELVREYVPFAGSKAPPNVVPRSILYYGYGTPEDWQADLRLLCLKGGASRVHETVTTKSDGYRMSMLEFRPSEALEVGAKCALVDRDGEIATWFEVVGATDTKAPPAPDVRGGHFETARFGRCTVRHAAGGLNLGEDPENPFEQTLYATWLGVEGAPPNYQEPPLTVSFVDAWTKKHMVRERADVSVYGNFALSGKHECTPSNFPYPQRQDAILGIKALDLAGNFSEPTEVPLRPLLPETDDSFSFGTVSEPASDDRQWLLLGALLLALGLGVAAVVVHEELS